MFPKTTIIARTLVLMAAAPGSALAAERWTADDAVGHALADPAIARSLEAGERAIRAEVEAATVVPTPTVGLSHEQVFGGDGVAYRETSLTVAQTFDLTGWRGRLRAAIPNREAVLRAELRAWRLDVARSVREAFYAVLYHERRAGALDAWVARLDRGVTATSARRARGDAATYELRRVQRELATARARRASEVARVAEAWASLARWVPWSERPSLLGELRPAAPGPRSDAGKLPRLARLEQLSLALDAEASAWGSPMLRGWTISGGYRLARAASQDGHGLVLALTAPLALWNNDAPELERLHAERARLAGELELQRRRAERSERGARERLEGALAALDGLTPTTEEAELTRLAETAYGAGEATLTELLDAYASATELELARADLAWEARRAAIALDRERGMGVER